MNNGLGNLKQLITDHEDLWGKPPEEATIVECRAFAKKHELKLPKGLPQKKEAFVAMFVCCRLTNGWEGKRSFHENFPSLINEHEKALFAYRNRLAAGDDVSKKGPHLRVVSSLPIASELAEYKSRRRLPIDPKTGKRFTSEKAWHTHNVVATTLSLPTNPKTGEPFTSKEELQAHNIAVQKSFDYERAEKKRAKSKSEKKPSVRQTWPEGFASMKAWHEHNQKLFSEFKAKEVKSFESGLDADLVRSNNKPATEAVD